MLPSETMIWQPEFTDKTLSRKPGAVHSDAYRRIESVAEVKGKLRVLDLKRQDVQDAVATAENAETLFSSGLADDYQ